MEKFKKDYPYADFSKFYVDTDDHGKIGVFTTAGNLGMVSVHSSVFLKSRYAKWLNANKPPDKNQGAEDEIRAIYGSNYDKAVKNSQKAIKDAKRDFLNKYPSADLSKFNFSPNLSKEGDILSTDIYYKVNDTDSYDITSDTFKNNKDWTKYLTIIKIWPKIWSVGVPIKLSESKYLTYPKNAKRQEWGHHKIIDTKYLKQGHLGEPFHNFKVYVTETDYFLSQFPPVTARWSTEKTLDQNLYDIRKVSFDYKNEPYFAMIAGMYIASFLSGISLLNLKQNGTPNIIKSIARYHLYYQTRKFMKNPNLIDKYDVSPVKKHIPIHYKNVNSSDKDEDGNLYGIKGAIELSDHDYYSFIAYESKGITAIGLELLQQSIESYVYSVLGAQARTRWSITGKGAKSSQTQNAFRKIVEDTIVQSDDTVTISNMRTAIQTTNVILNMTICPGVILVPSDMIIQKEKIPGYNNVLTIATSDMTFGSNKKVNYVGIKKDPNNFGNHKKTHESNESTHTIDNLNEKETHPIDEVKPVKKDKTIHKEKDNYNYEVELAAILLLTSIPTYFILKHI